MSEQLPSDPMSESQLAFQAVGELIDDAQEAGFLIEVMLDFGYAMYSSGGLVLASVQQVREEWELEQ